MTYRPGTDFFTDVARGLVAGQKVVNVFARNPDVDTTTEDVWAAGAARTFLGAAETMDLVSTSANDDGSPVGTGARVVTVEGLDANYLEVSEDVTMNGVTAVTTTQSFLRVLRAYVKAVGTVGSNDGIITIDPTTTGAGARQIEIAANDGQSLLSHYTVPDAKTAYMHHIIASVGVGSGAAGDREVKLRMWTRLWDGSAYESWRVATDLDVRSAFGQVEFHMPLACPERTDMYFDAIGQQANCSVYVSYDLLVVDD